MTASMHISYLNTSYLCMSSPGQCNGPVLDACAMRLAQHYDATVRSISSDGRYRFLKCPDGCSTECGDLWWHPLHTGC
eukprot:m.598263 g.598263  ORF g.598263 m.598263 type:complete len:78 (-) comp22421_c0_seq3:2605-2838(-)